MAIKLIVTDLDGTFLNSNHLTIPGENLEAFEKAHKMGIKVAIASGRTKVLTDYLMEQLPFLDYLITSNGAVTYDLHTSQIIDYTPVENRQSVDIFNILSEYSLPFEIYFNGGCFMSNESYSLFDENHIAPHIYKLLKDFITPVPSLEDLLDGKGMEKLNILSLSGEQRLEIERKISEKHTVAFASSFPLIKGVNGNLEMTHPKATKGLAVERLCNILDISGDNVMCFGDGENDCSMLSFAKYSFAMENGNLLAKKTAKYTTDTNDNGGVAKAIKKYVFGE